MDKKILRWLYQRTKFLQVALVFLSLLSILLSVSRVAFISASKNVLDGAIEGQVQNLYGPVLALVFFTFIQLFLRLLVPALEDALQTRLEIRLREQLLEKIFSKSYLKLREVAVGEWMTRFFSDTEITANGLATLVPNYLRILVNLGLSVYLLYQLVPEVTLALAVFCLILFALNLLFRRHFKEIHKSVQSAKDTLQVYLQEIMTNLVVTKVFQAERQSLKKLDSLQESYGRVRRRRRRLSMLNSLGMQGSVQIGYLFVICLGSFSITQGKMSYGTLVALMQLVNNLMTPISNLSGATSRFYALLASSERLMDLEELPSELSKENSLHGQEMDFQALAFEGVAFSYPDQEGGLKNVDFSFSKGEKIALTGTSGNGKSTLFYVLMGLYPAQAGRVVLSSGAREQSYEELSLSEIRSMFTYVPQGHALFSGTVRDNLLLGQPQRTDEELWQALEMASAKDFIEVLPDQLDHRLGQLGKTLSEGQQQRLALARAFLSDAPILLLDEATSALDEKTERKVLVSLASLKDKTAIIVTHRPASLEVCDRQLILEDGKVREGND